jgi:hypothetical protein
MINTPNFVLFVSFVVNTVLASSVAAARSAKQFLFIAFPRDIGKETAVVALG